MIPGFQEWLNYRGTSAFGDEWYAKELFNTTEVFVHMLGRRNYHYAIRKLPLPLPDEFEKGRFLWSKEEAEKLWHWAYENGWFNAVERRE